MILLCYNSRAKKNEINGFDIYNLLEIVESEGKIRELQTNDSHRFWHFIILR